MPQSSLNKYFFFYLTKVSAGVQNSSIEFQFQIISINLYIVCLETKELYVQIEMFLLLTCVSSEFEKTKIN